MQQKSVESTQALQQDSMIIRVFIISGVRILLWSLQQLITNNTLTMQLVGSASSIAEAIDAVASTSPDVVLLDMDFSDASALDIPTLVACSNARVLVLIRNDDQALQDKVVLDGARGVLNRHASPESFVEAIAKVSEGQLWLDRAATGRIFVELSRRQTDKTVDKESSRISTLTPREKKIVACIFENSGDTAKTIAEKLHISESTLRNHLTSVYEKLGVSNRFELISYAHKHSHSLAL